MKAEGDEVRNELVEADLTVLGGGLAGVCAAIAAARLGRRVALVQNRPVLGGVSSSEVRVWVGGATGLSHNRQARESGIIGEMLVENQYRNPEGNPYIWDLVVLEKVKAEPNITLFLNTDVREVDTSGPESARTIRSCTGWMMGSERLIRFESPLFVDCTGDGLVGLLSQARYRATGRRGQPPGRWGHHRSRTSRQGPGRWLHPAVRIEWPRRKCRLLQNTAVRHVEELRTCGWRRLVAGGGACQS